MPKLKSMEAPYDEATAYHEAGHAVVALAVGRPVHRVSVLPNRERLGVCEFRKGVFRPTKDWLEEEILISLAGIAAEARHTGAYAWDEAGRDLRYVRRLAIQRAGDRQAERLERRLLAKAENLLADDELWRAVELIAAELLRLGSISGRAVQHFYDQCRDSC
jgi:ATP-dependent Zn protease